MASKVASLMEREGCCVVNAPGEPVNYTIPAAVNRREVWRVGVLIVTRVRFFWGQDWESWQSHYLISWHGRIPWTAGFKPLVFHVGKNAPQRAFAKEGGVEGHFERVKELVEVWGF